MKTRLPRNLALALSLVVLMVASSSVLATQDTAAKQEEKTMAPKKTPKKKRSRAMGGIPKGAQACVDRLIEIASADPLPAFGGQAEQIVNNGLLWDDPKSKCSIGSDQGLRKKVSDMGVAWREKNAEKTRSLLQEIKSAAPTD
jgi:hypothetical protein